MAQFRFLHAADIHLDSPLRGLSRYEGVPADEIRHATRKALDNLVDHAVEEKVAFVVIAGDLYDGDWDDFATGLFFCASMRRLNDAGIEVYITLGNHDAESQQTRRLPTPPNVHVFSHKAPQTLIHETTGTALHGQSYKDRDPGGNLAAAYPAAQAGRLNIGVLHTALTGRPPHAPYAPCTPADLTSRGYDYWALGHIHAHEIVSTDPYIVFPGNLQGRNIRECGPKGAVLVTVGDKTIIAVEAVPLDAVRWAHVEVDVSECPDMNHVERSVQQAIVLAHRDQADGRALIARVSLLGQTALHGALIERAIVLREEVRAIATNISADLWIEKLHVATRPVEALAVASAEAEDVLSLLDDGRVDPDLMAALGDDYAVLFSRLPPGLGEDSPAIMAARAGGYDELLKDAADALRARLEGANN